MTKDEAIKIFPATAYCSTAEHQKQIKLLFGFAQAMRQDYQMAETSEEKKIAEFLYLRHLEEIDARLTLINR